MIGCLRGVTFVMLAASLLPLGCGKKGGESEAPVKRTPVRVGPVERRSFRDYFNLIGTARAAREATLVFEVGGLLEEVYAEQGAEVRGGDPIARLNDDILGAALGEAEAGRALAAEIYDRSVALQSKGGISEFELSRLLHERDMAAARFETAKSQHDRTVLRAPFAGLVDTRLLDVGDYANPATPYGRFLDLRAVRVEVPLPEAYLGTVAKGDSAEVRADPYPDRLFTGVVTFVSREVDHATRTLLVEVRAANEERLLRPGMTLRVRLAKRVYDSAIVVPQDALVETEGGTAVFVASQGAAVEKLVKVGAVYGQMAVVDSGLAEGDSLIVVGNRELVSGERVEVLP